MRLAYNLFPMFKRDRLQRAEYPEQIKTFCWEYIFLVRKIIRKRNRIVKYPSEKGCKVVEYC
jgi:hypothetical protein